MKQQVIKTNFNSNETHCRFEPVQTDNAFFLGGVFSFRGKSGGYNRGAIPGNPPEEKAGGRCQSAGRRAGRPLG